MPLHMRATLNSTFGSKGSNGRAATVALAIFHLLNFAFPCQNSAAAEPTPAQINPPAIANSQSPISNSPSPNPQSAIANPQSSSDFLARAKTAYESAAQSQSTNTQNLTANLDLARAAFDYADLAKTDRDREPIALRGIAIARQAITLDPNSAAAHYYLALNLGQYARTKMLGALKILTEMERELKRALELDPKFDYAGPNRTLGVLYLEAPGWPTSVGNKTKARANLERAVELAPDYPDNHLNLIEALQQWRDTRDLPARLAAYEKLLPTAKTNFTGAQWEDEWSAWDHQWKSIQSKQRKP